MLMRCVQTGCHGGTVFTAHLYAGGDGIGSKPVPRTCAICQGSGWVAWGTGEPAPAPAELATGDDDEDDDTSED